MPPSPLHCPGSEAQTVVLGQRLESSRGSPAGNCLQGLWALAHGSLRRQGLSPANHSLHGSGVKGRKCQKCQAPAFKTEGRSCLCLLSFTWIPLTPFLSPILPFPNLSASLRIPTSLTIFSWISQEGNTSSYQIKLTMVDLIE